MGCGVVAVRCNRTKIIDSLPLLKIEKDPFSCNTFEFLRTTRPLSTYYIANLLLESYPVLRFCYGMAFIAVVIYYVLFRDLFMVDVGTPLCRTVELLETILKNLALFSVGWYPLLGYWARLG